MVLLGHGKLVELDSDRSGVVSHPLSGLNMVHRARHRKEVPRVQAIPETDWKVLPEEPHAVHAVHAIKRRHAGQDEDNQCGWTSQGTGFGRRAEEIQLETLSHTGDVKPRFCCVQTWWFSE